MSRTIRTPSAPRLPQSIEGDGILVGWSLEHEHVRQPVGFSFGHRTPAAVGQHLDPILFESDGHLMTIAPTGSGKGTGCIIPTLLRYPGPVIVIDPKGENLAVTARRRREMGQEVIVLDPLGVTTGERGRLDPMDMVDRNAPNTVEQVNAIGELLTAPLEVDPRNAFWIERGRQIVVGLLYYLMRTSDDADGLLPRARDLLGQGAEELARLSQVLRAFDDPELDSLASTLDLPAKETFAGYLAFAQSSLGFLAGATVRESVSGSSFSLDDVTRGKPMSIYIVIPPTALESQAQLLRLWISTLIGAVVRRQRAAQPPTLFVLDEAAQLGSLPQLRQALTLLRGYGLRTWSFWQDASQLQLLYPHDWKTMVNNCKVLQAFGTPNMIAAQDVCALTGYPDPEDLLDLDRDEMVLQIAGDEAVIAQRPDYRCDPPFTGLYDKNPLHDQEREIMPRALKPRGTFKRRPTRPAERIDEPSIEGEFIDQLNQKWS